MSSAVVPYLRHLPPDKAHEAIQLLDARQLAKLKLMTEEIDQIQQAVAIRPLETDAEEIQAVELLNRGAAALKELEALRRARVDPLNAEVKAVNALFRVVTDPCEALAGKQGRLEKAILAYRQVKRARIQREQEEARRKQEEAARREAEALEKAEAARTEKQRRAALEAAEAASRDQAAAALGAPHAQAKGYRTDSGSVAASDRYVLQGIHSLDLVPQKYWRHEKVIAALELVLRAAVRAGEREIPGCSIGLEEGVRVSPGR